MTTHQHNQGRYGDLAGERATPSARSGEHAPSSGGADVRPGAAPRTTANTLMDDWGLDDVYAVHDGLGPDELDIEVEFEEPWHARKSAGAYLLAAGFVLIALVLIAPPVYRVLELWWEGRIL